MRIINPYYYALNPNMLAYENAWVHFNKTGKRIENIINDDIWQSWQRCKKLNINPFSNESIPRVTNSAFANKSALNKRALSIILPFLQTIYEVINGPGFMIAFCDSDGTILKALCDDALYERANQINLTAGAVLNEKSIGTNSVSISIETEKPFTVSGAEHYRELFHSLTSNSVPVFNHAGVIIGVISVWGRQENANPHTIGMITSSVKAIENEMLIQNINEKLVQKNSQLSATLQSISDGVIYVENGKITHINDAMLNLLHTNGTSLLNQQVSEVIITSPAIEQILQNNKLYTDQKIVLLNGSTKYNCLMDCKNIVGKNNIIGQVLIIKEAEVITKLAKSITKYSARYTFNKIVGKSESLSEVINIAKRAAEHDSRIILEGESGTGKEVFAQSIHNTSARGNFPFVALDCGAIPKELFESTLFGYEKGAFTGAKKEGSTGAF